MNTQIAGLRSTLIGILMLVGSGQIAQAQHFHGYDHHGHSHDVHGDYHHFQHGIHGGGSAYHCDFDGDVCDTRHDHGSFIEPTDSFSAMPSDESAEDAADGPTSVDDEHLNMMLGELQSQVNLLCLDLYYNYSHNAGFKETYGEAFAILQNLKNGQQGPELNDRDALVQSVQEAAGTLQHVGGDVQEWSRHQRRQVGRGGIKSKMSMIESLLGAIMVDLGVEPQQLENEQTGAGDIDAAPAPGTEYPRQLQRRPRLSAPKQNEVDTFDEGTQQMPALENDGPSFEGGGPAIEEGAPIEGAG